MDAAELAARVQANKSDQEQAAAAAPPAQVKQMGGLTEDERRVMAGFNGCPAGYVDVEQTQEWTD
eukprot:SAG22_NODE_1803_length_3533_cov_25.281013_2_plen_65_part_00